MSLQPLLISRFFDRVLIKRIDDVQKIAVAHEIEAWFEDARIFKAVAYALYNEKRMIETVNGWPLP